MTVRYTVWDSGEVVAVTADRALGFQLLYGGVKEG